MVVVVVGDRFVALELFFLADDRFFDTFLDANLAFGEAFGSATAAAAEAKADGGGGDSGGRGGGGDDDDDDDDNDDCNSRVFSKAVCWSEGGDEDRESAPVTGAGTTTGSRGMGTATAAPPCLKCPPCPPSRGAAPGREPGRRPPPK